MSEYTDRTDVTDRTNVADRTNNTDHADHTDAELRAAQAREDSGRRLLWAGILIALVGAVEPVVASLLNAGTASTIAWLVSMPLCVAGAGVAAAGYLRRRSVRSVLHEDWG